MFLGYTRADSFETVTVDVAREVRSVVQFLSPTFQSRGVTLEAKVPDSRDLLTRAGRGQVRQVLLNLLNNAGEAICDQTGHVCVALGRDSDFIEVTVPDNGPGVLPEHRGRLFSPFFSTKQAGTGLGLALVRSLVERTGGHAECSLPDEGHCQFRVIWPAFHSRDHGKLTS